MLQTFRMTGAHTERFCEQQRLRFEDEMVVHLRQEFASVLDRRDDAWLRELIRMGIGQARRHGIVLERDVARYLKLMLGTSPDFDSSSKTPRYGQVLRDSEMTAREKLDGLYELVLFGQDQSSTSRTSRGRVPQPFHHPAVTLADVQFRDEYPDLERRRLTMDPQDQECRRAWLVAYHKALADLVVPPATSRPGTEVGAEAVDPTGGSGGSLIVTLVDADSAEPIGGASVQVTGPVVARQVADEVGEARFEELVMGGYEILAVDVRHRVGHGQASVKSGETHVRLPCRQMVGV